MQYKLKFIYFRNVTENTAAFFVMVLEHRVCKVDGVLQIVS